MAFAVADVTLKMWENILQLSCLQPGGACLRYGLGLRSRGKATAHDATLAYCILYVQSGSVRLHTYRSGRPVELHDFEQLDCLPY